MARLAQCPDKPFLPLWKCLEVVLASTGPEMWEDQRLCWPAQWCRLYALVFKVSHWPWVVSRCRPEELRVALNPTLLRTHPCGAASDADHSACRIAGGSQ